MKDKRIVYFLVIIVVGVWGLILHKVFGAIGNDNETSAIVTRDLSKGTLDSFEVPKDTARLILNYRDPFSPAKNDDTVVKTKNKTGIKIPALHKDIAMNWSFIAYSGYIRNPSSKKIIALLSINGHSETLSEGETKQQVKLVRNLRDSIQISFGGKTKFIHLKTAVL